MNLIDCNNYFNPYCMTFSNPLTYEMVDIIVLYHYVMTFLIFILLITFFFILLSLRRVVLLSRRDFELNYSTVFSKFKFYNNVLFLDDLNKPHYFSDWRESRSMTHAPVLEFLWIVLPTIILIFIIYPSLIVLYSNENFADPILNISVIGNQWFWSYEYNDFSLPLLFHFYVEMEDKYGLFRGWTQFKLNYPGASGSLFFSCKLPDLDYIPKTEIPSRIAFDSNLIIAADTTKFPRLLTTDNVLVLPSKTPLRLLVTSNDVIHSWAVPSYGIKVDAIPGRINQQVLFIPLMGTAWGQCSELCGVNHAFMPIEVKALPRSEFNQFIYLKFLEAVSTARVEYIASRLDEIKWYFLYLRRDYGFIVYVFNQMDHTPSPQTLSVYRVLEQLDILSQEAFKYLVSFKNPLLSEFILKMPWRPEERGALSCYAHQAERIGLQEYL